MFAVIHRGHPAWLTLTCVLTPEGLPWSVLLESPVEHLGPQVENCREILTLCAQMPGTPLGLTFDAGIAVSATDYALAESRYDGQPSPWIVRWAGELRGPVLDLACGAGRHARYLARRGLRVLAVDRDEQALNSLRGESNVTTCRWDLEQGDLSAFEGQHFAAIIVTNYLHRPLFGWLGRALAPGGMLLYETFMRGQERYGKPTNPDFLLEPGELRGAFPYQVVAYEESLAGPPIQQRLCVTRAATDGPSEHAYPHHPLPAPQSAHRAGL